MATIPADFLSPGSQFVLSQPITFAWIAGAVLFVLFIVFVLSQSASMMAGQ